MNEILESTLDTIREYYGVPGGFAVAVKDGKTVLREAFGVQNIETGKRVDDKTLFTMASVTKTFTSTLCAILCDEGLLDWDTPVKTYWPEFHYADDYLTEHLTLADMLGHRTGAASNNALRYCTELKPMDDEYVMRILDTMPAAGYREKMIYSNDFFRVAGYIMKLVTGKEYEELIQEKIAKPLGMDIAFTGMDVPAGFELAAPHSNEGQSLSLNGPSPMILGLNNPCGGIRTNLRSMEKWAALWANECCLPDGTRLLSEAQYKRVQKPVQFWAQPMLPDRLRCYALGWAPSVYRGHRKVYHGGSISGYNTAVAFFPDDHAAIAVALNVGGMPQRQVTTLRYMLCDLVLGSVEESYRPMLERYVNIERKAAEKAKAQPKIEYPVSAEELGRFCGTWWNKAFHNVVLSVDKEHPNALHMDYYNDDNCMICAAPNRFKGPGCEIRFQEDGTALISMTPEFCPNVFTKVSEG